MKLLLLKKNLSQKLIHALYSIFISNPHPLTLVNDSKNFLFMGSFLTKKCDFYLQASNIKVKAYERHMQAVKLLQQIAAGQPTALWMKNIKKAVL